MLACDSDGMYIVHTNDTMGIRGLRTGIRVGGSINYEITTNNHAIVTSIDSSSSLCSGRESLCLLLTRVLCKAACLDSGLHLLAVGDRYILGSPSVVANSNAFVRQMSYASWTNLVHCILKGRPALSPIWSI